MGWYLPETGAQMGVLVAESFEPQLVKAVGDGRIVHPEHGLWLVEACGYLVGDLRIVHYTTRACSLGRAERIERERAYRKGGAGAPTGQAEATARAARLFDYLASTASGYLKKTLPHAKQSAGFYRVLEENGYDCHVALFAGTNRISIGSCYRKGDLDEATLERMVLANANTEVDSAPDQRYLRGTWWHLRRDLGRDTPDGQLPPHLGEEVEEEIAAVKAAVDVHQLALREAASAGS